MKNERWEEIERLNNSAMQHKPDERAAWLQQAAADKLLKKEVECLLACRDNAVGSLDYATSDYVEDVKRACAREAVLFDNDIFNELAG